VKAVASFDVFETVLFRCVGEPRAVFLLLGRRVRSRGLVSVEPEVFAAARVDAEHRARGRRPTVDTTLALIHRELAHALRTSGEVAAALQAAELELEQELLRAPAAARAPVDAARHRREQVVFVSDSYLPEDFVRAALARHGLWSSGDRLYVSCARGGANKATGELFDVVKRHEKVAARTITHLGNHPVTDVAHARERGLRASHLDRGNLTADERLLEDYRAATGGLSSLLAGASRLARLASADATGREAVIRDIAAGVGGPTLVAFVLWVLTEASRRGLERLYFLSREGHVLLQIAERLVPKLNVAIDLQYLHVSRQSLNVAAMTAISEQELRWALTNAETNTVRTLLERVAVSPEAVLEELRELGVAPSEWDAVPVPDVRERLLSALLEGSLRPALEEGVAGARKLVLTFLGQQGVLDDLAVGVVDTTGTGSQLRALAQLRHLQGRSAPIAMLLHRKPAAGDLEDDDWFLAWYEDQVRELGWGLPPGGAALLEVLCAVDHGTVLGYDGEPGTVRPVLADTSGVLERWGLVQLRRTILDVAEAVVLEAELVDVDQDLRAPVRALLERLWTNPTLEEARAWGAFPFEGTSGSDLPEPLARPYTLSEVAGAALHGRLPMPHWYTWEQASERLSPPHVRAAISSMRALKRTAGMMRPRLPHLRRHRK